MRTLTSILTAALMLISVSGLQAATWEFDMPHSSVGFKVKHLMISNVTGEFKQFSGTVKYNSDKPEKSSIDVTIDLASVDTRNEDRDEHLRSADFFNVAAYPTMTYQSKRVEKVDGGLKVYGELTLHGVTKDVVLDVEGPTSPMMFMGSTRVGATATATVDRRDFGITWNKNLDAGGVVVGNEVKISIEVELVKAE